MTQLPLQSQRTSSLHFFEEIFLPFIEQSRSFTIRYQFLGEKSNDSGSLTIAVHSVNEFESPDDFYQHLSHLTETAIHKVNTFLQQQNPAHIDAQVDYILHKLDSLAALEIEEAILVHDEINGTCQKIRFNSFLKPQLIGPFINDSNFIGPTVCFKSQKYVEVWLKVITETKDKVDLICNMLKGALNAAKELCSQQNPARNNFKIRFNSTVDQEAFLFDFLVKTGIIDIPDRKNPELIAWISNNIQSKNCESNSVTSLRNKFYHHELSTLDYWDARLTEGLKYINQLREHILKYNPK